MQELMKKQPRTGITNEENWRRWQLLDGLMDAAGEQAVTKEKFKEACNAGREEEAHRLWETFIDYQDKIDILIDDICDLMGIDQEAIL